MARIPLFGPLVSGNRKASVVTVLVLLALVAGAALFAWKNYQRVQLDHARIAQVDVALRHDAPGRFSPYCRQQYGANQEYGTCLALEQRSYQAFATAWARAKAFGTWREQMIGCLFEARHEGGVSWTIASKCSESDAPGPETRN